MQNKMQMAKVSNGIQAAVDAAWVATLFRGDGEFVRMARNWAEAVGKLPKRQLEQVNWVMDLNKFYDHVVNPFNGGASTPSMTAIASGRAAQALLDHIGEIARWMDFRERHGGSGKMSYEQCLDRVDQISDWCARNGVGRLTMKVRELIAKCKDYVAVMRRVQEVVK